MSSFEPIDFGSTAALAAAASRVRWLPADLAGADPTAGDPRTAARRAQEEREAAAAAALAAEAAAHAEELQARYQMGVLDGRAEGEAAEAARLRTAVAATSRALDELRAGEAHWTQHLEENLAALGVAIAQQILAREVTLSTEMVQSIVRKALAEFPIDQPLVVRLHPADCALVTAADLPAEEGQRAVRYVSDARVQPGGCLVEGRDRIVDGRVDTALERLYRRLSYTNA